MIPKQILDWKPFDTTLIGITETEIEGTLYTGWPMIIYQDHRIFFGFWRDRSSSYFKSTNPSDEKPGYWIDSNQHKIPPTKGYWSNFDILAMEKNLVPLDRLKTVDKELKKGLHSDCMIVLAGTSKFSINYDEEKLAWVDAYNETTKGNDGWLFKLPVKPVSSNSVLNGPNNSIWLG